MLTSRKPRIQRRKRKKKNIECHNQFAGQTDMKAAAREKAIANSTIADRTPEVLVNIELVTEHSDLNWATLPAPPEDNPTYVHWLKANYQRLQAEQA